MANTAEIKQAKRRETLEQQADMARISRSSWPCGPTQICPSRSPRSRTRADRAIMEAFFNPLGFKSTLTGAVSSRGGSRRIAPRTLSESMPTLAGLDVRSLATVILEADEPDHAAQLDAFLAAATAAKLLGFELELSGDDPMRANPIGLALAIPDAATPGKLARAPSTCRSPTAA